MIDLNLIRAFVTIYETGSVSAAAERLHVSQPSISYTLKRLRDLLGEPLFKRTRDGMAPTYFATQLYEKFRIAISEIEGAIESTRKFDPYLSSRRFRLAMSDLGEIYLLPHLMAALQKIAPDLGFDIVAVEVTKLEEWLNAGKIDAAVCCRRLSRPRISCSRFRRVRPAGLQLSIPSELSICHSRSANSKSCCGGKSIAAISLLNAGSAKLCGSA